MGKKIFTILVAMILCVSLAACGHDSTPAPKDDDNATAVETADPADVAGENGEADTATDEGLADGTYEHHIGDCVFYTENDLDQWINDGVFDFYGMMDYFGWTGRWEGVSEDSAYIALEANDGTHSDFMVRLLDDGDSTNFPHFTGSVYGAQGFDIVILSEPGEKVSLSNGMKISYNLCELMLYTMESAARDPHGVTDDLSELSMSIPENIAITWN